MRKRDFKIKKHSPAEQLYAQQVHEMISHFSAPGADHTHASSALESPRYQFLIQTQTRV